MTTIVEKKTRYVLMEGSLEERLRQVYSMAFELVEKVKTLRLRDKPKCKFEPEECEIMQKYRWYDYSCSAPAIEKASFGFIATHTLEENKDSGNLLKAHKRLVKSFKKYHELMVALLGSCFDLDNLDDVELKYFEGLMDKLGNFSSAELRRIKFGVKAKSDEAPKPVEEIKKKISFNFVDGFIGQGKTEYMDKVEATSYELSEAFRIKLSEKVLGNDYLHPLFYDIFVLWGIILSVYVNKQDLYTSDVEKYIERVSFLNPCFDLLPQDFVNRDTVTIKEADQIRMDKRFFINFMLLNGVDEFKLHYFTRYNTDNNWVNEPPTSFLPHRKLEKTIYGTGSIWNYFDNRHHFLKLFVLFYQFKYSEEIINKIAKLVDKQVVSIGGCLSLINLSETNIMITKTWAKSVDYELIKTSPSDGECVCENQDCRYIMLADNVIDYKAKRQPWYVFWHGNTGAKCLIDDAYEHGAHLLADMKKTDFFLLNPSIPCPRTARFRSGTDGHECLGYYQFVPVQLIDKSVYTETRPCPFIQKSDCFNENLEGFRFTNINNDGIDVILKNTICLPMRSMLPIPGIVIEETYARDIFWCVRSRYADIFRISFEPAYADSTDKSTKLGFSIVLSNFSDKHFDFKKDCVNLFQFIPAKKVVGFANVKEMGKFWGPRLCQITKGEAQKSNLNLMIDAKDKKRKIEKDDKIETIKQKLPKRNSKGIRNCIIYKSDKK